MPNAVNHPSADQLRDFDQGRLSAADWASVERHVVECTACANRIAQLPEQNIADLLGEYDPERGGGDTCHGAGAAAGTAGSVESALPVPSAPPELLDHPRYRLLGLLGSGGMGMVFKAEHRLMGRPVALKLIHRHLLERPAAVERFQREARAAARLGHPNIVTAHDAEQAGAAHFLVMEYVEGETLDRVVERSGPLSVAQACDYVRQAALGLQHAHERGMVHRDLKPANLIVTAAGQVKILDFGLAQLAEECRAGLTPDGALIGTPEYLAPEQARDPGAADVRADLYSLGCTLYHLLAGAPPFRGTRLVQQLLAHQEREPKPLCAVRNDIPPALAAVVARLLAKDPTERFQTPAQLADALAPFVRGDARPHAPSSATTRPRASHKFWTVAVVVLGAAVVTGGAVIAWKLTRGDEQTPEPPLPRAPAKTAPLPWSARPTARDLAIAWLVENNVGGPKHPIVADTASLIERDATEGRAFQIRLGPGLVKSGKSTLLAGRHHDLHAFTFTPEQAVNWVAAKHTDFTVSTVPRQEIHSHPLVELSAPRIEEADALDPLRPITGTVAYRRLDDVTGTLTLRLTCITKRGARTLFEAMPELRLAEEGRIGFDLGAMYKATDTEPVPRGPTIFFLELGRWPAPPSSAHMVLISNMVAVPIFFKQ